MVIFLMIYSRIAALRYSIYYKISIYHVRDAVEADTRLGLLLGATKFWGHGKSEIQQDPQQREPELLL